LAYEEAYDHTPAKKKLEQALRISPNYSEADKIRKILAE
jgi:Tfp pilus assembly protein PilF